MESITNAAGEILTDSLSFKLPGSGQYIQERRSVSFQTEGSNTYSPFLIIDRGMVRPLDSANLYGCYQQRARQNLKTSRSSARILSEASRNNARGSH